MAAVACKLSAELEPVALHQRTGLGIPAHAEAREGELIDAYEFGGERFASAFDAQCIEPSLGAQLLAEQELTGGGPEFSCREGAAHQRLALRVEEFHAKAASFRERGPLKLPVCNQLELHFLARVEGRAVANQHRGLLFLGTVAVVVIVRVENVFWGKQPVAPLADGPGLDAVSPFFGGKFLAELLCDFGEPFDFQFCAGDFPVPVIEELQLALLHRPAAPGIGHIYPELPALAPAGNGQMGLVVVQVALALQLAADYFIIAVLKLREVQP